MGLQRHGGFAVTGLRHGLMLAFCAVVGVAGSAASAHAQAPPARVVVSGEGKVNVIPDLAQVRSGVTTNAKNVKEAVESNSRIMAAIITALTESGIAQKDIQTAQFSIQPVYSSPDQHSESKLTAYRVSNQVIAKIRHIDKLGDVLERLAVAGATDVWNIDFMVSDPSKALDEARETAIADARRKAEVFARAAGVTLGRVVTIEEESAAAEPLAMRNRPMAAARDAVAVPIASGENTVRAVVIVGFDLAK
jgi:uncharacterized protein YggE